MPTVEELRARYTAADQGSRLAAEKKILEESFRLVTAHQAALGAAFDPLAAAYTDAKVLWAAEQLPWAERRALLCTVYEAYFAALVRLPWKQRRHLRAETSVRRMRTALKRGGQKNAGVEYWLTFAKYSLPPFAVGIAGELWFLDIYDQSPPLWQLAASLTLFVAGFLFYFRSVYETEGQRLFSGLQKWLRHRADPREQDRPVDLLQGAKMLIPIGAALGGAMIKLYFQ